MDNEQDRGRRTPGQSRGGDPADFRRLAEDADPAAVAFADRQLAVLRSEKAAQWSPDALNCLEYHDETLQHPLRRRPVSD